MRACKKILLDLQGKSKMGLHKLYGELFRYQELEFTFAGTGMGHLEELNMFVFIPEEWIEGIDALDQEIVCVEHYLLAIVYDRIQMLSTEYENNKKDSREKPRVETQKTDDKVLRRNGMVYNREKKKFILKVNFGVPLVNAVSVNGKAAARAVSETLECIRNIYVSIDQRQLNIWIELYRQQMALREYLRTNEAVCFVADGSTLPRENGTDKPMEKAIPFISPDELSVSIKISEDKEISGMLLKKGITVITGSAYSGKSTLMRAIEAGIYNHIPGDGREYVVSERNAIEIYAEEGRPVTNLNMEPFFRFIPGKEQVSNFSTEYASGSVSQAANVIEAVQSGSKLLLVDEDKSATNFMVCDENMRRLIKGESIIPFTDRIKELVEKADVSTILVIGSLSEYLAYADEVILMEDFRASSITRKIMEMPLPKTRNSDSLAIWKEERVFKMTRRRQGQEFLYFKSVITDRARKIYLDEFLIDLTCLTSVESGEQLALIAKVVSEFLCVEDALPTEEIAERILNKILQEQRGMGFVSEVRKIDIISCLNRIRARGEQRIIVEDYEE